MLYLWGYSGIEIWRKKVNQFDGTPCALKGACTVWSGGKSGGWLPKDYLSLFRIYCKTALAVYKQRRFHIDLMTGLDIYNLILTNGEKNIELQGFFTQGGTIYYFCMSVATAWGSMGLGTRNAVNAASIESITIDQLIFIIEFIITHHPVNKRILMDNSN